MADTQALSTLATLGATPARPQGVPEWAQYSPGGEHQWRTTEADTTDAGAYAGGWGGRSPTDGISSWWDENGKFQDTSSGGMFGEGLMLMAALATGGASLAGMTGAGAGAAAGEGAMLGEGFSGFGAGAAESTGLTAGVTEGASSADLAALYGPSGYGAGMTAGEVGAAGMGASTAGMTAEQLAAVSAGTSSVAGAGSIGNIASAGAGSSILDQLKNLGSNMSLKDLLSIGSGVYGMTKANDTAALGQQAITGSAPWTTSGGTAMAGDALKNAISGNFADDGGFKLAELNAARTSAQQPGGYSASAAANAAYKYQNDRIAALSGPAGVGFSPATGYQTALDTARTATDQSGKSLASIGFGLGGGNNSMPPWLQQWLVQNGMGG